MRTRDPARREQRRNDLLDAALRCYAERGYHATRTADICSLAGMSSGNLFHYFDSKHEVLLATVERDGVSTEQALDAMCQETDPLAALFVFVDQVCELAADPVFAGFSLEIAALAHRDEDVATRFRANDRALRDGLARLIQSAQTAGQVPASLSPPRAASWLAALIDGMFARIEADPDFDPRSEAPVLNGVVRHILQQELT